MRTSGLDSHLTIRPDQRSQRPIHLIYLLCSASLLCRSGEML